MSSSDAMFEDSSVYYQSLNEQAAHVNIDIFPSVSTWAVVNPLFLLLSGGFRLIVFNEWKSKGFGGIRMIFSIFVNFSSQDLKGHL